jgi:3-oxoadipate enol-lactonase
MEWLEKDGVGLRYEYSGHGERTLVLIHEMGCTLESWDLVLPLLSQHVTRLRFDTRGAGLSTKLRGTARISDMASDIVTLLDSAGRSGPIVVTGGAVGGAIALHLAARYPDRVLGVAAFGPATFIPAERKQAILDYADQVERTGVTAVSESELARSYPEALRGDHQRFLRFRARWLANDPGSYAAIYRMLAGLDMTADLVAIGCPALLLAGRHDPLRPPELIEPLSRTIQGARFKAIDTGHFAATQTPELVAATLNTFLDEVAKS